MQADTNTHTHTRVQKHTHVCTNTHTYICGVNSHKKSFNNKNAYIVTLSKYGNSKNIKDNTHTHKKKPPMFSNICENLELIKFRIFLLA